MTEKKKSVYETLSAIDVSRHVEVKGKGRYQLKYLSWVWAWGIIKELYPDTPMEKYTYFPEMILKTHKQSFTKTDRNGKQITVYRTIVDSHETGERKVPYLTTTRGTLVECTVVIDGQPYTENLYVMDNQNRAIINPDAKEIYVAQKRCLAKCIARAGLGLNLYAGEGLPIGDIAKDVTQQAEQQQQKEALRAEVVNYKKLLAQVSKATNRTLKEVTGNAEEGVPDGLSRLERAKKINENLDKMLQEAKAKEAIAQG